MRQIEAASGGELPLFDFEPAGYKNSLSFVYKVFIVLTWD